MSNSLSLSILAMEYPGYSICSGSPSCQKIEENVVEVMDTLVNSGFSTEKIFVMGRSIGSGPALHLSSIYPVGALILLSPFLSLC